MYAAVLWMKWRIEDKIATQHNLLQSVLFIFFAIGHYWHAINGMYTCNMDKLIDFNCNCQMELAIMDADMVKLMHKLIRKIEVNIKCNYNLNCQ